MSQFFSGTSIKPWLSVAALLTSFFIMIFLQMETRRMGYVVWKQVRELKSAADEERLLALKYAKYNRPERLQELAVHNLTLNEIKNAQVIHMSGDRIAVR